MELDRWSRGVELAVCLSWVVGFYWRLRTVRSEPGETVTHRLETAIRPIRLAALAAVALSVVCWFEASRQGIAHALLMPSLVVLGIATAITTAGARRAAGTDDAEFERGA